MSLKTNPTSKRLTEIAKTLADAQSQNDAGQSLPPDIRSVVQVILKLKDILFDRFSESRPIADSLQSSLEIQLNDTRDLLAELITRCQTAQCAEDRKTKLEKTPLELSEEYLGRLPSIRESLMTDVQAAYDGDPACCNTDEVILCYPGLMAILVYRLAHELHSLKIPFLPRMMSEWVHGETGIDIHPGATIGDHFFIDHGTGVVIGATCRIGQHVKIYQGVTLGALSFPQDENGQLVRNIKRHPTIRDNVVIYANATVLGGNTVVGHDSVIGSSVWLTSSVDPFTTVVMEKPKLRMRNETPSEFEPPLNFNI